MPHGWIILDKPHGLGSTQAVAAVKRVCRQAGLGKVKVGHGGTLDPLATGVLPIALGEATKLTGRMLDASKVYAFTIAFGAETDTLDLEGQVIAESAVWPTRADVEAILPRFTGPIQQVPPAYSAIKVDGERAYDLARAGEQVELKAREVTVHQILPHWGRWRAEGVTEGQSLGPRSPSDSPDGLPPPPEGEDLMEITLVAHVSKGTYIRSLARDIARALETVGHVTMLCRIKAGPFGIEQAISLDKLNQIANGPSLENVLLPLEAGLVDIPALDLGPEQASMVRQGRVLTGLTQDDGLYWARAGTIPVALLEIFSGEAKVVRGFNLSDVAE